MARGRGDACQRSLGNRPRSESWLLQSPLPGREGVWRLASCDRPLSPERVRPAYSVQDGHCRFCTVICQRGGFSNFPGSEGCLLSDPHPSILEEAIEVHVGGDGLPVPRPVFWTIDRSPGLHQGLRSRDSLVCTGSNFSRIWTTGWFLLPWSGKPNRRSSPFSRFVAPSGSC